MHLFKHAQVANDYWTINYHKRWFYLWNYSDTARYIRLIHEKIHLCKTGIKLDTVWTMAREIECCTWDCCFSPSMTPIDRKSYLLIPTRPTNLKPRVGVTSEVVSLHITAWYCSIPSLSPPAPAVWKHEIVVSCRPTCDIPRHKPTQKEYFMRVA